jgi:hypothetical protein
VDGATRAKGPVFDASLPWDLAWGDTRASDVLCVVAPGAKVVWTDKRTPESLLPYESDPILESKLVY